MGKHGPCCHCGVTSTPLWRNGPPEKPILCNACGSRWRTKGSLVNYTPLHARNEPNEYEDYKIPRIKIMMTKPKEIKVLKRKQNHENKVFTKIPDYKYTSLETLDEETSNRSSSGSAISNVSESCVRYGSVDVSELTGPAQSVAWDQMVPSRKRTCVNRPKQSQVEKLTKDLYNILQEQQLSHFSASSDEDLLLESDQSMVSVEIGHGSVLIRHPSTIAREEDSEASSIPVENKVNTNREKDEHEKLLILENRNSPLCNIDLKEIINYQVFSNQMTNEEQQQLLLQLLPDIDTATIPHSLQRMFTSPEFEEDLLSFQKLLSEGVFDFSLSGVKAEDYLKLKILALSSSKKSTWVEQYSLLKEKEAKSSNKGYVSREGAHDSSPNVKRSRDGYIRIGSGTKTAKKSLDFNNFMGNGGSFFPPKKLFPMMNKFQFVAGNSEQDLLLEVPTNHSFPEAELFYQNSPSNSVVYPRLTDSSKAF